ncbi:MAG: NAD(P)/FAD-dependent oxidoreductase [Woeseia sp.]
MRHADVIVVGGGPAGSTCAWKLHQAGQDVLVLDRADFPRMKLCAGWITPRVVEDLELETSEYPYSFMTFNRLEFNWRGFRFRKKTLQHSIRRYEFDDYLLRRSAAEVVKHKVRQIETDGDGFIIDGRFRCNYIVGAGGTGCPVYRQLFHDRQPRAKGLQIATFEHEFAYDWQDEECRLWFFEDGLPGYAWYVPKAGGYLNVGLGGKADAMKAKSLRVQDHWKKLVRKLERQGLIADAALDPSGYSYFLRGKVDTARLGNAFIVGDAVGLASVDMGEGIGPAVQSAILAARAISGEAEDYNLQRLERFSVPAFFQRRNSRQPAVAV